MTRQGKAEAATSGWVDASLLAQQLDGSLSLAESLRTATRVRLATFLSAEEALHKLGKFTFVTLHLFSAGRSYLSAIAELLCIIEGLEELCNKVQGMISYPHLSTILLYNVLWRWSLYLNRWVFASASEALEAPGGQRPLFD